MISWIKRLVSRSTARHHRRPRAKLTLTQRIDHIVATSSPRFAIRRLTGFRAQHYWHAYLRYTLGTLHLHHGDRLEAAKLLYFKSKKTPVEERAVDDLRRRYGNDPAHLLRALLGQSPRSPKLLRTEVKLEVWELMQFILEQDRPLPAFLARWYHYLKEEFGPVAAD